MSQPVCPYCRMPLETAQEAAHLCPVCGTPHHEDCWEENGGCTVFGCAAAPIEEALVRVSGDDLHHGHSPGHLNTSGVSQAASPHFPPAETGSFGTPPPPPLRPPFPGQSSGTISTPTIDPSGAAFPHPELQPEACFDRQTYVLLAVFCGYLGAHNLYANRTTAGIIQLCATVLTCFLAIPVTWIWALVEAATIDRDGMGNLMH